MTTEWVIAAYDEGASVPFGVFRADWASRDFGTGRVELFKRGQSVEEVTLTPSQRLVALPFNF
jgi:hypothetical protein